MNRLALLRLAIPAFFTLLPQTSQAAEVNDSVDTYNNHTVSTTVSVQGRTQLSSTEVTVTPTGYLKLSAPQGIRVNGPFEVQIGGKLELNGGRQWRIRYMYDAAGNRTKRKRNP